jgi:hypothetical protein
MALTLARALAAETRAAAGKETMLVSVTADLIARPAAGEPQAATVRIVRATKSLVFAEADLDGWHVASAAAITVGEAGIFAISWGLDVTATGGAISNGYIVTLTAGTKTYSVPYVPQALGTTSVSGGITLPLTASSTVKLAVTNGTTATTFSVVGDLYLTLMCR